MKTITLSLLISLPAYVLPGIVSAQPTISTNEFYYVGDVVQMINCDPAGFPAGASGANASWDFSALVSSGGVQTTTYAHDTLATSTLLVSMPDGSKQHIQENNTDSYLLRDEDSVTGVTIDYNNYNISKRPVTYMTLYTDSFRANSPAISASGTGHLTTTGDGYGTLTLPTGTYTNVLRVKKLQTEIDTIAGNQINTTKVSYLWFDNIHHAPLLRIDSVIGVIGAGNTIMYLAAPTAVATMQQAKSNYQCYMHDNSLSVTGSFDYGKKYEVIVYNIIGAKIYSKAFTADGNAMNFDIDHKVNDGIYLVSITENNDLQTREVIKVVKQ